MRPYCVSEAKENMRNQKKAGDGETIGRRQGQLTRGPKGINDHLNQWVSSLNSSAAVILVSEKKIFEVWPNFKHFFPLLAPLEGTAPYFVHPWKLLTKGSCTSSLDKIGLKLSDLRCGKYKFSLHNTLYDYVNSDLKASLVFQGIA